MTQKPLMTVAVAVLKNPHGQILFSQRPANKRWGGWWEFPGGKVETHETLMQALHREVREELSVEITAAYPWITRHYDYLEYQVKLHFFMVRGWQGDPYPCEQQQLVWQDPRHITVEPVLPSNTGVIRALQVPEVYAISQMQEVGKTRFLRQLEQALPKGIPMLQIREKRLMPQHLSKLVNRISQMSRPYGTLLILNHHDPHWAEDLGMDGIHLPAQHLMQLQQKPARLLCGASCHTQEELAHAAQLELDWVVLGSVQQTLSHPSQETLGWERFSAMILDYPLPVFALGGLQPTDMSKSWRHGAHGIAMQRALWKD